jgi:DNA-binding Lrp family transcriptional regulator
MIGIQADPSRVATLAQQLADIKEIGCVIVLLGRYSLLAMGLFTNIEQLNELITSRIRSLEGVRDVETSISVHNVKYEVGIARITHRPTQPSE